MTVAHRRHAAFPLVVLPAVVLLTVALTYATDRFRASGETSIAILAAVALDGLWRRIRTGRHHGVAVETAG